MRVAVSKVLCYVCHSWAELCHTTLVSARPKPPDHPPTHPNALSTVPTTPLVQDTKYTKKRKAQPQPYTWHTFYFYVGLISKYMKHKFALPSFKKQTCTVSVCKCSHSCIAMCSWKGDSFCLTLHFIFQLTAPSRGKALSVDFFHSIATFHCKQRATRIRDIDRLLKMEFTFVSTLKERDTVTFFLFIWIFFLHQTIVTLQVKILFFSFHKKTCQYC